MSTEAMKTNIRVNCFRGNSVSPPRDNEQVEVISFRANNAVFIKHKRYYSSKLLQCDNEQSLINQLTKPSPIKKRGLSASQKKPVIREKAVDSNQKKPRVMEFSDYENGDDVFAKNGCAIDYNTGNVLWQCRSLHSLGRAWRNQAEKILNSLCWRTSVFLTAWVDTQPSFKEMNQYVTNFSKQLKRIFLGIFLCAFVFLEPNREGDWHVHMIIGFTDRIPDNFSFVTKKWWENYNNLPNPKQVDIKEFNSLSDLEAVINYLNPTVVKKKKCRIKYYPKSSQPIRSFGKVREPNRALTDYKTVKTIVGTDTQEKRTRVEILDADTGETLYFCTTYHCYNIKFAFDTVLDCLESCKDVQSKVTINYYFPWWYKVMTADEAWKYVTQNNRAGHSQKANIDFRTPFT